jgi:hypothetical protein
MGQHDIGALHQVHLWDENARRDRVRPRRIDQHAGLEFLGDAVCRQADLDASLFERGFDEVRRHP